MSKNYAQTRAEYIELPIPRSDRKALLEKNTAGYVIGPDTMPNEEILGDDFNSMVRKPIALGFAESAVVRNVTLESTYACNLACKYCFVGYDDALNDKRAYMDLETAKKFMVQYMPPKKMKDRFVITFFGGEPLLNMKLITRLVPWARNRYGRAAGFSLTTNGTLMKEPIDKFLPEDEHIGGSIAEYWNRTGNFLLSVDGPKEVHDAHRPLACGKGSHDLIMENLDFMKATVPQLAKRFRWRPTYTRDIIESGVTYLDRLRYFNDMIQNGFGRTTGLGYANEPFDDWSDEKYEQYLDDLLEQYLDAADWCISEVRAGRFPMWTCVLGFVGRIYRHSIKMHGCGAGNGLIACGVDGTLYACHRTKGGEIGHIDSGFDPMKTMHWADSRYYRRKRCPECDYRNLCGGGCKANSIALEGDIMVPDHHACNMLELAAKVAFYLLDNLSDTEIKTLLKVNRK